MVQNLLMPHMIDLSWMNAMKTESIFEKIPGLNMPGLILLAARPGMGTRQEITKSQLLEQLSMDTPDCVESSLKVHVSNLRRKLREAGAGRRIPSCRDCRRSWTAMRARSSRVSKGLVR